MTIATRNSVTHERSIIGTMLVEKRACDQITSLLLPEDFFDPFNQKVFKSILQLLDEDSTAEVSTLSVSTLLQRSSDTRDVTYEHLLDYLNYQVSVSDAISLAKQVSDMSGTRTLAREIEVLYGKLRSDQEEILPLGEYVSQLNTLTNALSLKGTTASAKTGSALLESFLMSQDRVRANYRLTGISQIDNVIRNVDAGEIAIIAARPGVGKALTNDTPVLTPTGWVRNGDLKVGDQVIGSNGKATTVTGVFPQGMRQVYRVEFKDHSWIECDGDHLWSVHTFDTRKRKIAPKVLTTAEMIDSVWLYEDTPRRRLNYGIDYVSPVEFDCPVSPFTDAPYALGTQTKVTEAFSSDYLFAAVSDRHDFLRGILDTHGYINGHDGYIYITSENMQFLEDVAHLAMSLGGRADIPDDPSYQQWRQGQNVVRVQFRKDYELNLTNPLLREKYRPSKRNEIRFINAIIPTSFKECTCISVDAPDKLYVAQNFLVTHNTTMILQSARANAAIGHRPGIITLEMTAEKLLIRLIAAHTSRDSGLVADMKSEDIFADDEMYEAAKWLTDNLVIDDASPYDINTIKQKIYNMVWNEGCNMIYVDYIGLIDGQPGTRANRQEQVSQISRTLKVLSMELKIPFIVASQLNREVEHRASNKPGLADLRDSGALEQDASLIAFIYPDLLKLGASADGGEITGGEVESKIKRMSEVPTIVDVAKHRDGPVFDHGVIFEKKFTRFVDPNERNATSGGIWDGDDE